MIKATTIRDGRLRSARQIETPPGETKLSATSDKGRFLLTSRLCLVMSSEWGPFRPYARGTGWLHGVLTEPASALVIRALSKRVVL